MFGGAHSERVVRRGTVENFRPQAVETHDVVPARHDLQAFRQREQLQSIGRCHQQSPFDCGLRLQPEALSEVMAVSESI